MSFNQVGVRDGDLVQAPVVDAAGGEVVLFAELPRRDVVGDHGVSQPTETDHMSSGESSLNMSSLEETSGWAMMPTLNL